ncbi:hypothetical protein [Nocardia cerradoensis]|uniref:hypothetical protein n=1 Tax=Nocardia cerradoensis TaxID=85688 RepID=UPI00030127DD|nr:hypothetical protein [Nocardia cerradoensis]NKY43746.1 hypothetical protein [Nocardia cerradoensis]
MSWVCLPTPISVVVHATDGRDGALRRIAAAREIVDGFGIATECGFGRRPAEHIPDLLDLHAELAATCCETVGRPAAGPE